MKVFIDPSCDILYSSFYIYGIYNVFGKENVKYSSQYFYKFEHQNHFFAFVVINDKMTRKIIIDFTDSSIIDSKALDWCDVYGKVNYDPFVFKHKKIIAVGPSFGIKIYNFIETIWFASINYIKAYKRIANRRKFFSNYKAQFKRPRFSDYRNEPVNSNFVFFMSSLWREEIKTNRFRASFIRACKSIPELEFEGGFAPRVNNDIKGFEDLTFEYRVPMHYYLDKLKRSLLVFNTPVVKNCHGWKLSEYLCLGKVIISTPLSRELPMTLDEGIHLLYTDGSDEDIILKIKQIQNDKQLRAKLSYKAEQYFETFLKPNIVIEKLISV